MIFLNICLMNNTTYTIYALKLKKNNLFNSRIEIVTHYIQLFTLCSS